MTLLFLFGALVQLNDPDPALWLIVYLAAATSSLMAALGRRAWLLAAPTAIAALVWALTLAASMSELAPLTSLFDELEMKSVSIEETRELLGLCIISLCMAAAAIVSRRAHALGSSPGAAPPAV